MWRRLVARYLGVVEVVGSSPVTPTKIKILSFDRIFILVGVLAFSCAPAFGRNAGKVKSELRFAELSIL